MPKIGLTPRLQRSGFPTFSGFCRYAKLHPNGAQNLKQARFCL